MAAITNGPDLTASSSVTSEEDCITHISLQIQFADKYKGSI